MPGRRGIVCAHVKRAAVDRALVQGKAANALAATYSVSAYAVRRHKARHLPARKGRRVVACASPRGDGLMPTQPAGPSPPRTLAEEALVRAWSARQDDRAGRPPKFEDGGAELTAKSSDEVLWAARLAASMGTADGHASTHLLTQLKQTFWHTSPEFAINAAVALVHEIGPRDGLEAVLAVQMAAVHNVAREQLRRAQLPDQTYEGERLSMASAARLLRLFTEQMEALARHRGKASEQRVTVEHVHVHEGGQAIVGAVSPPAARPTGEGGDGEN